MSARVFFSPLAGICCLFAFSLYAPVEVSAQSFDGENLYYSIERNAQVYNQPGKNATFTIPLQEAVEVIEREGFWSKIRTDSGEEGYVANSSISNVWIRISKRKKTVFVYRGVELIKKIPADFGNNIVSDKIRRGDLGSPDDWRTPEGSFFVVSKNPNSKYYKALVLNYPNSEDARRGYKQGLISKEEYQAIVRAEENHAIPPMNTMLGGWIEIHGDGTGGGTNWTQGCIAIENHQMDELWDIIEVGTPVLTEY